MGEREGGVWMRALFGSDCKVETKPFILALTIAYPLERERERERSFHDHVHVRW